jgi:hypothetical protein
MHPPMRSFSRSALLAPALLAVAAGSDGCELRLGSEGAAGIIPSLCKLSGGEKKLAFGAGATSFAFAWDGDHYVVVYGDPNTGEGDVFVAKMSSDGTLLGSPVDIEPTPATSDLPALLRTSDGWIVAWEEGSAGKSVFAHALDANASPSGSGSSVATTDSIQARPVLANAPGGRVAVSWMDSDGVAGGAQVALVDPHSLATMQQQQIDPSSADGWPWVAGDARALGMAWCDGDGTNYDVRFESLDPAQLTPSHQLSLRGKAHNGGMLPRMISTGRGFLAAWEDMRNPDYNQIFAAAAAYDGTLSPGGLVEQPNTGDANWPGLAWAGNVAAVVYYQWRDSRPQIFLTLVDALGARIPGSGDLRVSNGGSGWSKYPWVVWTGSELGVMYVDTRDGAPALWFQRISCNG